jgi:NADH-quinone oxidoreductase subunit L
MFLSEAVQSVPDVLIGLDVPIGQFFYLVPWVVFFPLIGLLINGFLGGKLGERAIGVVASLASGLSFVISVLLAVSLFNHPEGVTVPLLEWIHIGSLQIDWAFQVDTLSVTMMLVVSGVGTLIHIYAVGYMHADVRHNGDPGRFRRFFVFMNLFIAAMMVLVSADSYLMLFVGWEGVGLCSYLLIGFWYDKGKDGIGNALAAKKAFIANRVGDFGFLIAMFLMFWAFGSLQFESVFAKAPEIAAAQPSVIFAITLFMLVGVAGKSAQIPLYVWLPDAMAGPTPVSALIHAATMVTAGVYLVARSNVLYSLTPEAQAVVVWVGGLTAFFAATIAVAQFDIKKVLAYSTISQLGFMVAAVGMGAYVAGMFHLVTHAFFKALLFLSAGSVIQGVEQGLHHVEHDVGLKKKLKGDGVFLSEGHFGHAVFDVQDMRNMGGLRTRMKTTFVVYLVGALALAGIFPLAGFWSKDEILAEFSAFNPIIYWLLTAAAFLTAFYMGRQVFMVFFGKSRTQPAAHAQENPPVMTIPLIILAIFAFFSGVLNLPTIHTFTKWLEHTISTVQESEFNIVVALISTGLALAAIFFSWMFYSLRYQELQKLPFAKRPDDPLRSVLGPLFTLLENKYKVDELYKLIILDPYVKVSRFLADVIDWRFWHDWFHDVVIVRSYKVLTQVLAVQIDLGLIDGIANGLARLSQTIAASLRRLQTGFVRNYALAIFVGVIFILGYLIVRVLAS